MSTFWSVFYGVFLACSAIYLIDIVIEYVKGKKRKRDLQILFDKLEDEEDDD